MSDSLFGLGNLITSGGRTSFSGPASGIPTQKIIEAQLKPQQERIDRIETKVEENNFKIDALKKLRSRISDFKAAAAKLDGSKGLSSANNVFENKKLGQATTTRFDSQSASDPSQIIGAQLSNDAKVRDHSLEVLQKAQAEQVASSTFTKQGEALDDDDDAEAGENADGELAGSFQISLNNKTESVDDTSSTLQELGFLDSSGTLTLTNEANGNTTSVSLNTGDNLTQLRDALNNAATNSDLDGDGNNGDQEFQASITGNNELKIESLQNNVNLSFDDGGTDFLTQSKLATNVDVSNSDTLVDIRDKINNADARVTASVVEISDNKFQLSLTADKTGNDNVIKLTDLGSNDTLVDLGLKDGSGNKNVIREAKNARFTADNIKEQTTAFSERVSDTSQNILDAGLVEENSDFSLNVKNNSNDVNINIDVDSQSLDSIATEIQSNTDGTITASTVDTDGDGTSDSLKVDSSNGNVSFGDGGSTFLENTNLNDEIFERQSNTVDDVFQGVTLNIRKAEDGTTVNLPVKRDLKSVQEGIQNFVDKYNAVRRFVNAQREGIKLEGQSEDTVGVLKNEGVLDDIQERLNSAVAGVAKNVDGEFSTLREIGIQIQQGDDVSDPLNANTLKVKENLDPNDPAKTLNEALNKNFESVRNLFEFDFRTNSTNIQLLDFTQNTLAVNDFTLDINTDGSGDVQSSGTTLEGSESAISQSSTNPNILTATDDTNAQGLKVGFLGDSDETIRFSTGVGIGAKAFFESQSIGSENDSGVIQSAINRLESENATKNDRLDRLERQLEKEREELKRRFASLEGTLGQLGQQQQILQARLGGGSG